MERLFVIFSSLIVMLLLWVVTGYSQADPDLLSRIEALENAFTNLEDVNARSTLETLKTELASLEALKTDLTQVRGAVDGLRDTTLTAVQNIKTEQTQNKNTGAILQATVIIVQSLKTDLTEVQNTVATLQTDLAAVKSRETGLTKGQRNLLDSFSTLAPFISVKKNTINGMKGPHVLFTGANIHIRNSARSRADGKSLTGLGNLVVGFNEEPTSPNYNPREDRGGSHNLIIGGKHRYTSFGGLVAGNGNTISNPGATVTGGSNNKATGHYASVLGGTGNTASGSAATVSGGQNNVVGGRSSSVSGGFNLQVSGDFDWGAGSLLEDR